MESTQRISFVNYHYVNWLEFTTMYVREGVQRRHDPRKNDLRASEFAELPPGPAKLVSQPQ